MADSTEFGSELWIILGLYMGVLLIAIVVSSVQRYWAGLNGKQSQLVEHYLAGRSLGPITTGFSLCASMFSGYTCVGLPAEAYKQGFSAWRWVGSCTFISIVYIAYAPRLQWLSRVRGYDSTLAFFKERYGIRDPRKDVTYWLLAIVVFVPCMIYLCAQFVAFANTINTLSNDKVSTVQGSIFLGILIALYEILGGLRAVAATDVIQGAVLLFGSLSILFFMDTTFDGLGSITSQLEVLSKEHVEVMSPSKSLSWAEFWIGVGIQRALFPDYPQRAMAANSQASLRTGNVILAFAPFLIQVPLCFVGIIGRVEHPGLSNAKKVFSLVTLDIVNSDATGKVIGSLVMAASVAAIMSTADSVLIVVSQLITLDFIRPFQKVRQQPMIEDEDADALEDDGKADAGEPTEQKRSYTVWASRSVTLVIAALCVPVVGGDVDLSFMIQFQSAILMQTFPTFVMAMYWTGMHKWASFAGLIVGVVLGVALITSDFPAAILTSFGANVVVTLVAALLLPGCAEPVDEGHSQFLSLITWRPPAEAAAAQNIEHLPCIREPISHNWWMLALACALPWFAIPFYWPAGQMGPYLSGSPAWAVVSVMVLLLVHSLIAYIIVFNWAGAEEETVAEREARGQPAGATAASLGTGPTSQEVVALKVEIRELKDKVSSLSGLNTQVRDTIRDEVAALFQ